MKRGKSWDSLRILLRYSWDTPEMVHTNSTKRQNGCNLLKRAGQRVPVNDYFRLSAADPHPNTIFPFNYNIATWDNWTNF